MRCFFQAMLAIPSCHFRDPFSQNAPRRTDRNPGQCFTFEFRGVVHWFVLMLLILLFTTTSFANLQTQLSHFHTFSAGFKQTLMTPSGQSQTSSGRVWIQKPGQFRWQVNHPNHQLYVSNGKTLWDYEKGLQQVIITPLNQQLSQTPLLLLSGKVEHISKLFTVKRLGAGHYQLTPKAKGGLIQTIRLQFSRKSLKQLQFTNTMHQTSTINFHDVHINPHLAASLFQFTPPKGIDVLH